MYSASGGPLYAADGEEATGAGRGSLPSAPSPNKRSHVSWSIKMGEMNTIKRPKKRGGEKERKEKRFKRERKKRTSFLYINSKFYSPYSTEAGSRGQRKQAERGRQGEGKRTWRETERVEEEAKASAREPEARRTPGLRAQPPSDPGP